jgi:elongation factor Ts
MTVISASLVKDLREKTGAGMMDCKKALDEAKGDIEAAVDWLRKKGLAAAAKKAGRVAAEGLVAVATSGNKGVVLEVNAETDFVARNPQFQEFVQHTATLALEKGIGDLEALSNATYPGKSHSVADEITALIATIGENMSLRRVALQTVPHGAVVGYTHNAVTAGLGKIGVLVALHSTAKAEALQELGKKIAMHVAAASPLFLQVSDVDNASLEREKAIFSDQARASGKPEAIIEKMVEGRVRKYYEEVVLLEQTYVMDNENKIAAVLKNAGKDVGGEVTLAGFNRFALGEGIEKTQSDFASEVKQMAG